MTAPVPDPTVTLKGLPPELARILRDGSIIVPQDAAVFELIASWAKAPSNTASASLPTSDDTRDRAHPATDAVREAEALLALEKIDVVSLYHRIDVFRLDRDGRAALQELFDMAWRACNRAPAVIRALLERVKYVQGLYDNEIANANKHDDCVFGRDQRIAALEAESASKQSVIEAYNKTLQESDADLARLRAERDIWKDRCERHPFRHGKMNNFLDPTPAEIAARVEQNRKEQEE